LSSDISVEPRKGKIQNKETLSTRAQS